MLFTWCWNWFSNILRIFTSLFVRDIYLSLFFLVFSSQFSVLVSGSLTHCVCLLLYARGIPSLLLFPPEESWDCHGLTLFVPHFLETIVLCYFAPRLKIVISILCPFLYLFSVGGCWLGFRYPIVPTGGR